MCDFCNNIINEEDYRKKNSYDRINCLVKINSYDYGLWIECEDWYYSGVKMQISYCPMCGRQLTNVEQ